MLVITIMNRPFFEYCEAMRYLGCSTHPHQLQRRIAKYPDRFLKVRDQDFVELEYAFAIARFHQSLAHLSQLKKSVKNENQ